ncbi:tail fiber protein [Brevibacillus brevis]|uniref:Tail fiber protein n=1 Tax=Brevibacillus brevis TaxID=1393 RepID=A0ABY9T0Y1_BREBE|nr:tail fiber protein [Brevibacillus brevis]WNC13646.1 tail fiber protein [Brevibacillus brevis]
MAEAYIGEIRLFAGNYAPPGWALCDGRLIPIAQNTELFSLIGTNYGGDGVNTFALPDLRGRIPVGTGNLNNGTPYLLGSRGGVERVTLTLNQIPNHTHTIAAESASGADTPVGNTWAVQPQTSYSKSLDSLVDMSVEAIASAGGNQPHDNMMPSLGLSFMIALVGIFPPRD